MRKLAMLLGSAALTLSGSAIANPIRIVNEVYVEQFPGTQHVQITRNYSSGSPSKTTASRDNKALEITFEVQAGAMQDLGSGMTSVSLAIGCDCAVPEGRHDYVVANSTLTLDVVAPTATTGKARAPSAQCDVKCAAVSEPLPATGGTSSTGTGGADSTPGGGGSPTGGTTSSTPSEVVGKGGSPATGGTSSSTPSEVVGKGGSPATGGAGSTTSTTGEAPQNSGKASSGCTIARTDSGRLPVGRLPAGLLAAFGLLAIRRRK